MNFFETDNEAKALRSHCGELNTNIRAGDTHELPFIHDALEYDVLWTALRPSLTCLPILAHTQEELNDLRLNNKK
jgi:hypothetical protein